MKTSRASAENTQSAATLIKTNNKKVVNLADGRYEGNWENGKRNGHGTYFFNNGNKYEGNWVNDKKNGHGTFYFNDGNKYEGNWENDKINGHGTIFFNNGGKYEGN